MPSVRSSNRSLQYTIGLAVVLVPRLATAQAEDAGKAAKTSSLSWVRTEGAESCIDAPALARAVEQQLGRDVFVSPAKADLSVEGRVEPAPSGGFNAVIDVAENGAPVGTRSLSTDSTDCRKLDDSVALAIALMIDPDAALGAPPSEPPPPDPPPKEEPTVVVQKEPVYIPVPLAAQPTPTEEDPWRFDVRAGGVLTFGLMPGPAVGVVGGLTIEPPWFWALEGQTYIFFDKDASTGSATGTFSMFLVEGSLCPLTPRTEWLGLDVCGGGQLGRLAAEGPGLDGLSEVEQIVVNAQLHARGTARVIGPAFIGAGATLFVPFVREEFSFVGSDLQAQRVHEPTAIGGSVDFHLGLRFP